MYDPFFDFDNNVRDFMGDFITDFDFYASRDKLRENIEVAIADLDDSDERDYSAAVRDITDACFMDTDAWCVDKESTR